VLKELCEKDVARKKVVANKLLNPDEPKEGEVVVNPNEHKGPLSCLSRSG
jgi:hypothetical protein